MVKKVQYLDLSASLPDAQQQQPPGLQREEWENATPDALNPVESVAVEATFCAGHGAYASPDSLFQITLGDVLARVKNPQNVRKEDADWFVTCNAEYRTTESCTEPGVLSGALVFEFDKSPPELSALSAAVQSTFGDVQHAAYTTASATKNDPRCRLLVPVLTPLDVDQRAACQELLYRALVENGFTPDASANDPAHVQFMPNNPPGRGPDAIYEYLLHDGAGRADPLALWAAEISEIGSFKRQPQAPADPFANMPDEFWTLDRMQHVLATIHPSFSDRKVGDRRKPWRLVGFACYRQFGYEMGLRVFQAWSRGDLHGFTVPANYNPKLLSLEWDEIKNEVVAGKKFGLSQMLALAPNSVVKAIRSGAKVAATGGDDGATAFMPLHIPSDTANPIASFFRTALTPFPMATLPPLIREWAIDQSKGSGFDPGAYAYILLATFASWIDQRSRMQVSAGSYSVPAFHWAGLVDASGGGKTPVLVAANKFIAQLNSSLVRASMNDGFDEERAEQRIEDYRRRCEEARDANLELPPAPPNYRFRQRIIADATVEAIAEMASGNPEGLIYLTDDISTFIGSLDAYSGKGKDRAFYLGLNDTKKEHPVNRKGKPPLIVEHLAGSLIAGMQPGVVAAQTKGGNSEDGLFQRFTLYQMATAGRVNLDFVTNPQLDVQILEIFRLAFAEGVINTRLNPPARKLAEDYINVGRNERHIGKMAQSHAQKLIGYTFRIAFALHVLGCLCEGRTIAEEVGVVTLASAVEIVECLRKHALTVFDQFDGGEIVDLAQYALEQILNRGLTEFTQGDLSKHHKGWVSNDRLNLNPTNALDLLCERGVIACGGAGTTPVGGRPATKWLVNPQLHINFMKEARAMAKAKLDTYQQLKRKFSDLREVRDNEVWF